MEEDQDGVSSHKELLIGAGRIDNEGQLLEVCGLQGERVVPLEDAGSRLVHHVAYILVIYGAGASSQSKYNLYGRAQEA